MKQLWKWLGKVPHLFSKLCVIWCIVGGTGCCIYALRILSRTDKDPAATLAAALVFLGGELALLFGRDSIKGKEKTRKKPGEEEHHE